MTVNENENRNWYIRLTEKFFFDKEIIEIENISQARAGMFFPSFVIHLYFKMLCFSIRDNGLIVIRNSYCDNDNISYMIANMFGFNSCQPYVEQAMKILLSHNLIDIYEDTEKNTKNIFLREVVNNTGSLKLSSAQRQQRRIAAKEKNMKKNALPEAAGQIKKGEKSKFGYRQNILLFEEEFEELSRQKDFMKILQLYSEEKAIKVGKGEVIDDENDYEELLKRLQ